MRTPRDIREILQSTGIPFAYRLWPVGEAPPLPYGVYYAGKANNFAADGKVYFTAQRYTIELYTEEKDPNTEALLENALNGAEIFWTKDEAYIESERMNEISYEIEV